MKNKIAVVGGNGYLGAHVTKYFRADSLSRSNRFDMNKISDVKSLRDYDIIIHMAAIADKSQEKIKEVIKQNIQGTKNIVDILNENQTLIFTSSKEVHNYQRQAYGESKSVSESIIEDYCLKKGFKSGIFRLSTTYAPSTNGSTFVNYFINCVKEEKRINLKMEGRQIRDFLYVDDLSRAFDKFINSPFKTRTWEIGGGPSNAYNFIELLWMIGKTVGKDPLIDFSNEEVKDFDKYYVTNIGEINRDLNWFPETSLNDGIEQLI